MSLIEILVIVTVIDRLLVKNALNHSLNQAVLKHTSHSGEKKTHLFVKNVPRHLLNQVILKHT